MSELYCCYCGSPKGERIQCCKENHFISAADYFADTGYYPDDGRDDAEWAEELTEESREKT